MLEWQPAPGFGAGAGRSGAEGGAGLSDRGAGAGKPSASVAETVCDALT